MDGIDEFKLGRSIHPWERALLEEGGLFLVGGSVRDMLTGKCEEIVDSDYIATRLPLDRIVTLLESFGKTDLVGRSFGVIKFRTIEGPEVDIAMPRTESSTGSGHREFDVVSDPFISVEEDLKRRDFTINSIALDLATGKLVDPLGGRSDLSGSILRVNSENSFLEDPLRMMRGVQFMARFGLSVEQGTKELMTRHAQLISTVSPERLRMELDKLLSLAPKPSEGLVLMRETGLLAHVLPELNDCWGVQQNEFHCEDVFHHSLRSCDLTPPVLHNRLAALLHDIGKVSTKKELEGRTVFYGHDDRGADMAEAVMRRLTYSNEMTAQVGHLIRSHMFYITDEWSDSAVRRFIARTGVDNIDDLLILRMADGISRGESGDGTVEEVDYAKERIKAILEKDSAFTRKELAIDGREIMKMTGIEEGREIGRILDILLEEVLEDPALNNRDDLLRITRKLATGESKD